MANAGKEFENQIRDSIKQRDIYYLRLEDPPQSFSQDSTLLRFSNKNPYDFIMFQFPFMFAIENKSKSIDSFSFSMNKKEKGKDIKPHQIVGLYNAYMQNVFSGFLFNFREREETYFVHIHDFLEFVKNTNKKSINIKDIRGIDSIVIPKRKKKVKYDYDIFTLIEFCKEKFDYYKNMQSQCFIPIVEK